MSRVYEYSRTVTVAVYYGDPKRTGGIEVAIDLDKLAEHLARRAFRSKGRRSRLLKGAIVGKVLGAIEEVPQ